MKRTFNYTQRQRINRRDVSIRLISDPDKEPEIEATTHLDSYRFPPDSKVVIEAYTQTATAFQSHVLHNAFDHTTATVKFEEIDGATGILFNIKVVDGNGSGLLLGSADRIPWIGETDEVDDAEGLLPVFWTGEGQLAWQLEFDVDGKPSLIMSKQLKPFRSEIALDSMFRSTVLPEILRRVLERALIEDDSADFDDHETWFADWVNWMNDIPDLRGHIEELDGLLDDSEQKQMWIHTVVGKFALHNRFVDGLLRNLNKEAE